MHDNIKNSAKVWINSCGRTLNAIEVMESGINSKNWSERQWGDACLSLMMLAGFAYENAFKAEFVSRGNQLYIDGKQVELKFHEFVQWGTKSGLILTKWEKESLEKAEFICMGWGRYPFHNNFNKEMDMELSIGIEDVEQVKNIVYRLLASAQNYLAE